MATIRSGQYESNFQTKSDKFQAKIDSQNIKNRSKISRDVEPMDVEPMEKLSIKKPKDSLSNDKEIVDIEDPW